jgi:hypothetical protein
MKTLRAIKRYLTDYYHWRKLGYSHRVAWRMAARTL